MKYQAKKFAILITILAGLMLAGDQTSAATLTEMFHQNGMQPLYSIGALITGFLPVRTRCTPTISLALV